MKQHTFVRISGLIFLVLGVLHLIRVLQGWTAVINGWSVPVGLSWAVIVVAAYLSYQAFHLSK